MPKAGRGAAGAPRRHKARGSGGGALASPSLPAWQPELLRTTPQLKGVRQHLWRTDKRVNGRRCIGSQPSRERGAAFHDLATCWQLLRGAREALLPPLPMWS